ncbi:MAG: hypothetical protein J6R94_04010, partial [Agathobacter sp.]|nr:hypothetical protein [Agathobacter sp.]
MVEKKSFIDKILPHKNMVIFDMIVLAILQVLVFFLPIATYVYQRKLYSIKGIRFLTGASIMKGKVTLEPNMAAVLMVAVAALLVIVSISFIKVKAKYAGTTMLILSVAEFVLAITFSKNVVKTLSAAKGKEVALLTASILMVGIATLMLIRSFHILYKNKTVGPLDFMALPCAL